MAVLAAILPVVSKSSRLTLELYQAATESPVAATDFVKVGSGINGFASILKQVGTIIKEDDRLPSHEVYFPIFYVILSCTSGFVSFHQVEALFKREPNGLCSTLFVGNMD